MPTKRACAGQSVEQGGRRRAFTLTLLAVVAGIWLGELPARMDTFQANIPVGNSPTAVAVNPTTNRIYIANRSSNSVTVINGTDNSTATVATGTNPSGLAVDSTLNKIYVANFSSGNVTIINGSDNSTATVSAGTRPFAVEINSATHKVYVANFDSGNVTVIDGFTNSTTTVPAGTQPEAVAVNSQTNKIYIANYGSNNVTVINGFDNSSTTVLAGLQPFDIAVNAATNKIYVANYGDGTNPSTVTVINGVDNSTAQIPVGKAPTSVAINSQTNKIYVTNQFSNNVAVINGVDHTVTNVDAGTQPFALAVNPSINRIYAANYASGNVTVINGTDQTTSTIAAGTNPYAVAVNSETHKVYVANNGSSNVTAISADVARLTVAADAGSSVNVTISPNDINGAGNGTTQFSRIFNLNQTVNLSAPAVSNGYSFVKWQKDGVDFSSSVSTSLLMDANHTLMAVYVPTPPANDNFANAQLLTQSSGSLTATNFGATAESGEPLHAGVPGRNSIWYRFQPPSNGRYVFTTLSGNPMLLSIYRGTSLNNLTEVLFSRRDPKACSSDYLSRAAHDFNFEGGEIYYISIDTDFFGPGSFVLRWGKSALVSVSGSFVVAPGSSPSVNLTGDLCLPLNGGQGSFGIGDVPAGGNYGLNFSGFGGGFNMVALSQSGSLTPLTESGYSVTFLQTTPTFGIRGNITLVGAGDRSGLTVKVAPFNLGLLPYLGSAETTPDPGTGNYSFGSRFAVGTLYTVQASKPNYTLTPTNCSGSTPGSCFATTNDGGAFVDVNFTASPLAAISTSAPAQITATSAILNGAVNANGLSTNAWFQWGTDPTLTTNTVTTQQAIGAGTASQPLTANLTNLASATTYYFRAVGMNSAGTVTGSILSFTTPVDTTNYTITVSASPVAGGTVTGGGTFASGTPQTVSATANSGYTFANWTENGNVVSTSSNYQFTLHGNRNLVANFTPITTNYTITVSASPVAGGTVMGGGTFASGTSQTVTATANSGYTFGNWTENGNVVSTSSGYQFTLHGNRNLVANFTSNQPTLENVVWTRREGVEVNGNSLTKILGDSWNNAGASSTRGIGPGGGYVEFTASENNTHRMLGLSNADTNLGFQEIKYEIYLNANGNADPWEAGVGKQGSTPYQAGNRFRITVAGGVVTYSKNGVDFYTSPVPVTTYPLLVDTSLYSMGATITDAKLFGNLVNLGGGVGNQPPVANPGGPYSGAPGAQIQFNGGGSSDPDGTITTYAWSFGDGTNGSGVTPTHSYAAAGNYTVSLTVTDNLGATTTATASVTISTGNPMVENVVWTRREGVEVNGNSLTKILGDSWNNAGASSTRGIGPGGGYVEFTASENNTHRMLGLSNADTNLGFQEIKYEIYLNANGYADPWEAGAGKQGSTPYQAGDRFRITVAGGIVTYSKNGVDFYTSPVAVTTYPLLVDTSLYSMGATITDAKLFGNLVNLGGGVGNQPPVANPGGPYSGAPGAQIQFNGGGSSDPDGTITTYAWSFGDGTNGSGVTPTHSYAAAGNYTVSLTVTDNLGATTTATASVTISTGNPMVENVVWTRREGVEVNGNSLTKILGDSWNNAGASSTRGIGPGGGYVEFTASENNTHRMLGLSNADTNLGFQEIKYEIYLNANGNADPWEAGVGKQGSTPYQAGNRFRITVAGGVVTYSKNGVDFYTSPVPVTTYPLLVDTSLYSMGATITDAKLFGNLVNLGGGVGNQPPVANPGGPYSGAPGAQIQFNGGGSSDPDGTITTYAWSFGDGTNGSGVTPTHSYAAAGNYTVSLTVTDNLGATTTATASVTISTGNPMVENVVWTRREGVEVNGNSLTKILGDSWNNAGASSTRGIGPGGGYVEFTASENNTHRMLGLSNADTNLGFQEIKYEIYLNANGYADPWEAGAGKQGSTPYQAGDRFRITVAGGVVTYSKNDAVFYTSPVPVTTYPLLVDTSLYSMGATITDVKLFGNVQNVAFAARVNQMLLASGGRQSGKQTRAASPFRVFE